jgi:enoyl-CoA hydratase/carnithine racemase
VRRVVCALAVIGLTGCGGSHHAPRLRGNLYLGLACDRVTAQRCNRVGLAVWVVHPASGVTALVDGVSKRLRTHSGGTGPYGHQRFWQGFFRDARAQRLADNSKSIPVRVRVTAPDGSTSAETRTVHVSKGYG